MKNKKETPDSTVEFLQKTGLGLDIVSILGLGLGLANPNPNPELQFCRKAIVE